MSSSIPFPTLVKNIPPGQDRFLSAARCIEPGQVLLVDWPHVLYPTSLNCLHVCCAACFCVIQSQSQSQQFICISCKVARFCSTKCLTRSHPALFCLALPYLIMRQPSCQSELLYLLSAYSLKSDALVELLSLPSHLCRPLDTLIKDLESQLLSLIPSNQIPRHFSHEITSSLLSINKTYALPIANPRERELEAFPECGVAGVRAYGLYFLASLIKHSCLPNVCAFNYINDPNQGAGNPSFVFRALDEIKVGTAICRSFIDINMQECNERMKKLKDEHGIECKCHRCDTETIFNKNQPMAAWHNYPYAEFVNQHTCNHCGDGCLAPLPPPQDGVISNLMECNKCSRKVIKDEPEPHAAEDSTSSTVM